MQPLTMILATARNGVIGDKGGLPWPRIPEDLKHFKAATMGHTLIVGRRTYETLPPLNGRRLVVVSRTLHKHGARSTIDDAIAAARALDPEPVVIGGAEVYRAALPFVTRILLTEIDRDVEGDTVFHLDRTGFRETARAPAAVKGVSFVTLERESESPSRAATVVLAAIRDELDIDVAPEAADATSIAALGDSLAFVLVVLAVDDALDVKIPDNALRSCRTVGDLIRAAELAHAARET